jgi:hypothetical protein
MAPGASGTRDLRNCLQCHVDGAFELPLPLGVAGPSVGLLAGLDDVDMHIKLTPAAGACASCHVDYKKVNLTTGQSTDVAFNHMKTMGGGLSTSAGAGTFPTRRAKPARCAMDRAGPTISGSLTACNQHPPGCPGHGAPQGAPFSLGQRVSSPSNGSRTKRSRLASNSSATTLCASTIPGAAPADVFSTECELSGQQCEQRRRRPVAARRATAIASGSQHERAPRWRCKDARVRQRAERDLQ